MRTTLLIFIVFLLSRTATAQNGTSTSGQGTLSAPGSTSSATSGSTTNPQTSQSSQSLSGSGNSNEIAIIDYKSVYEAETLEEEVKIAAERFNLTKSQQDVWLTAATDRREAERKAKIQLAERKENFEKAPVYKGLKAAQSTFYETIIGYLSPAQKSAIEADRLIQEERQRRLAKLAPPAPTVTVAPVDSAALKPVEKEKPKSKGKAKKGQKKG